MYSTTEAARMFRVSRETIRSWTRQFAKHLSPLAQGGGGRHRQYNDDDLTVLALVSEMRDYNHAYEDIAASLDQGQRGQVPDPRAMRQAVSDSDRRQIEILENQLNDLRGVIDALTSENNRKQGEIDVLTRQIGDERSRVEKYVKQIGKLEAEIERLRGNDPDA